MTDRTPEVAAAIAGASLAVTTVVLVVHLVAPVAGHPAAGIIGP